MKKNRDKELILEQLKKIPIMMVACEKVGIARSTVYRWRDDDKKFAKELEEALTEGESLINDMSESQLLSMIREKNWSAISFWLRHRNPKFRERVEVTAKFEKQEELTAEQEEVVREALKLASIDK
jgi:ACT domain-containing protein